MIGIAKQVNAVLRDWDDTPTFLKVRHDGSAMPVLARDFSRQVVETARQLQAWGIREKYLVPVLLGNSADFVAVFLALLHIGAVPVLAKLEYRALELDEIFRNAEPQAVITEKEHLPLLRSHLQNRIVITHAENRITLEQSAEGLRYREDIPDETASINYTYRGWGYPLGAMISHAQYLHGARVLQDGLQGSPGERMLVILPMAHIFTMVGCILLPLLYRMTSVIVETMHPRLLFQNIRDYRIEYITAVPELYELLYRVHDPSIDLSSLRVFVSGGSILTPESYANVKRTFSIELCHGYGLTEFTPVSGNIPYQARSGTVGPLRDQVQCRIEAEAAGDAGEILIKTPHTIGSYYRRQRESDAAHSDDWFRTGDIGHIDNGHLVFVKELKNTRKVNGNLVDLEEVSRAIRLDKDVEEVRVGWDNNSLDARLALSRQVDFAEKTRCLKSSLRGLLAGYKIPKTFNAL